MLSQLIESRRARAAGVAEERQRINRAVHDNIGVQLLGALHSPTPARKDALIRRTLTQLRDIICNPVQSQASLGDLLVDARAEIGAYFGAIDIALWWHEDRLRDETAPSATAAALRAILRAILREGGANNILRHSGATSAAFTLCLSPEGTPRRMSVTIADDGKGVAPGLPGGGAGLTKLRTRTLARGGAFSIGPGPDGRGCVMRADLPLDLPLDLALAAPVADQGI
jgi:two-component system sensor histidine kinase DevS